MDNVLRDLVRLELFDNGFIGEERFGVVDSFKDFFSYYTKRFFLNLKTTFKQFSVTELQDYNTANSRRIAHLLTLDDHYLQSFIVPIPKAMTGSYCSTISALEALLKDIQADALVADLEKVTTQVTLNEYSRTSHKHTMTTLGSLYATHGLSYVNALSAFKHMKDVEYTNTTLLQLTQTYYPLVFALEQAIKALEEKFDTLSLSPKDKQLMSKNLLSIGWRLTIFATVMDHVQTMEHAFVKSLKIFNHQNI